MAAQEGAQVQGQRPRHHAQAGGQLPQHGGQGVGGRDLFLGHVGELDGAEAGELHGAEQAAQEQHQPHHRLGRVRREQAAGRQRQGHQHAVDQQHPAEAEAAQHLVGHHLHRQVAGEDAQHQGAGLEGVQAQHGLEQQRGQEGHGADGHPLHRTAPDGDGVGRQAQGVQLEQRRRMAAAMADGQDRQHQAQGDATDGLHRRLRALAQGVQSEDQGHQGRARQQEAFHIQGPRVGRALIGHPGDGHGQRCQAQGQIQEEDPGPIGIGDDEAT
ncbi:hypothetical protein AZA_83629 [Nitrospirillum viridazoti Y2]|nr:hypothetical protein AZA_83629 [Nitrospirillum amazonense Y2]